jgi:hypothetical protein
VPHFTLINRIETVSHTTRSAGRMCVIAALAIEGDVIRKQSRMGAERAYRAGTELRNANPSHPGAHG